MKRTVLVVFCLGLLAAIGTVFTQVVATRVPEQRATLEKLITDRTGLAVRFDNVHFAWGMDGTSAVFERVELTDPVRGRVRVVAPELRVEFDTWDFLRHQQFSLGHVTLSSPDIDIIGDAEPETAPPSRPSARPNGKAPSAADEAALVRRYTAWAELMPAGRVEVEGARVHLFRRGERVARHNFTLSQAAITRGSHSFNAFGTLLLSQDIGQSLFVSAKLENLGAPQGASGELRLIARRVFLDKLPAVAVDGGSLAVTGASLAARGRGTVDARLTLRDGLVQDGRWQLSARELQLPRGARFDHFTVQGRLKRAARGFQLEFTDLQLTRDARLERAPRLTAQVTFMPGTLQAAGITASAERVPFMAAEFMAGALMPGLEGGAESSPPSWTPTAGDLRNLRFDSRAGTLSAQVSGGEIIRVADGTRISALAGRVEFERGHVRITFDPAQPAQLRMGDAGSREIGLTGAITLREDISALDLAALKLRVGDASLSADGRWSRDGNSGAPLDLELAGVDRALLGDAWSLLSLEELPQLADVQEGRIVSGRMRLITAADAAGGRVDWQRSRGSLEIAGLASAGADVPRLASAAGKLEFARGGARLELAAGTLEELQITEARIDWPRRGTPRLRAAAEGDLSSPLLRRALEVHGLRLAGRVMLEAEARGEQEMRAPESWRVTAKLSHASIPLGADLPPVEKVTGTVRLAAGQLRALALQGSWLGGPVTLEGRRAGQSGVASATLSGVAEAGRLLELLGERDPAGLVDGQLAWTGTLQRREDAGPDGWQLSLASNLAGVESRLPAPFAKPRARALPMTAELRFDAQGVREFEIDSGRDSIRGRVQEGLTSARFEMQGIAGELRASSGESAPRLAIEELELRRAPRVLAAAGALMPIDGEIAVNVAQLRHSSHDLGALAASVTRRAGGMEFSLETADGSPHEVNATGACRVSEHCRLEFTLDTQQLPALLAGAQLPTEWPTRALRASGKLAWPADTDELVRALTGNFELEAQGAGSEHQLIASASLADGRIDLANVQGTGPAADQVFRGSGRVALLARTYDVTVDYEQVSLAASAMPTPARMRLSRAWTSLRGSVARQGWAETAPSRRVQWHGSWD